MLPEALGQRAPAPSGARSSTIATRRSQRATDSKPLASTCLAHGGPSAISLLEELTDYSCSLGLNDTRLVAGWSAAHWQELFRQNVSMAVQRGNAAQLIVASNRRCHNRGYWSNDASTWYVDDEPPVQAPRPPPADPLEAVRLRHSTRAANAQRASQVVRSRLNQWLAPARRT
eukprot:COSAG06_NODE_11694_length_1476_cov_2.667393_1_plen_172_part_10